MSAVTDTPVLGAPWVQEYPGATTGIVVGPMRPEWASRLGRARAVLWCATAEDLAGLPAGFSSSAIQRVPLDDSGAARIVEVLPRFVRLDARHLPSLYFSPGATAEAQRGGESLVAWLVGELRELHRARVTRQQDAFRWQQHVLANLADYARRPLPESWRGALAGLPAAVCGAGPSLDVSAARLADGQEGCVVFAADSALRTLARHGVRVDFAVSVDVAKTPEKCLPESGEMPARVVLAAVSPPEWRRRVAPERVHFVSSRQITTDWLARDGVVPPALAVAENCGVTALELARWLGCSPIYLFGLDLALSGRQRHTTAADATIYARSGFDAAQEFPEVPGNWEPSVPTHAPGDWRALNARLATFPAGAVFNVNDRGARLENACAVRPGEWVAPAAADKASRLAAFEGAGVAAQAAAWSDFTAELRRCGERLSGKLPELRASLATHGPDAVAVALRPWLADAAIGRALGGYALKLMPHLLPPTEGEVEFWRGLLEELEQLAGALAALR
ncbi:MAG: DUF115 domain-containing protein [Opitutae bacterium]|nr:DUF115 domain-containing protein [Opitutae bacterium]